jgi:hypothetical protein
VIRYLLPDDELLCIVIKPVGYHDNHEVGEIVPVRLKDITQMIRGGYVELYWE